MKTKKKKVAAKKKPAKAAKKSGSQLKIVNLKVGSKDRAALNAMAKKYAKGNLSAWLRHAGLRYVPKKAEKIAADSYAK